MTGPDLVRISAGHGKAVRLSSSQKLKLINSHGTQVVDYWAFTSLASP